MTPTTQDAGLIERALAARQEVEQLLIMARSAGRRLGVLDRGDDLSLSHEVRQFSLAFSRVPDAPKPGVFQTGNGRHRDAVRELNEAVCALADRLEALSQAATAEPEGWRGIESAPKDGTPFDAWVPDAFGGRRMTGLSFNRRGQLRQHGLLTAAELPRWPTHWMPLPPAPEGT